MKVKKSKIVAAAAGGINTGINTGSAGGYGIGSSSHGRKSSNGMNYGSSGITKIKQGKQSFVGPTGITPKKVRVLRFRVGKIASKALLFNVYSYAFSLCGLMKRMLYSTNIFRMLAIQSYRELCEKIHIKAVPITSLT